jgi:hypothetical protein
LAKRGEKLWAYRCAFSLYLRLLWIALFLLRARVIIMKMGLFCAWGVGVLMGAPLAEFMHARPQATLLGWENGRLRRHAELYRDKYERMLSGRALSTSRDEIEIQKLTSDLKERENLLLQSSSVNAELKSKISELERRGRT